MAAFFKISIFFAVVASAFAIPQYAAPGAALPAHLGDPRLAPILSQAFDLSPDGSYQYSFESGDGTSKREEGSPVPPGEFAPHAVQGEYNYDSPEGRISVQYIADENGFQPTGPNIHPEIQRAVAAQVAQARVEGPIAPGSAIYH